MLAAERDRAENFPAISVVEDYLCPGKPESRVDCFGDTRPDSIPQDNAVKYDVEFPWLLLLFFGGQVSERETLGVGNHAGISLGEKRPGNFAEREVPFFDFREKLEAASCGIAGDVSDDFFAGETLHGLPADGTCGA